MKTKLKTETEVTLEFIRLSNKRKVKVLLDALEIMQGYNGQSIHEVVAQALGYHEEYTDDNKRMWRVNV